jgi:hypothetical protein
MKIKKLKVTTEMTFDDGETKIEILEFDGLEEFSKFANNYADQNGDSIKQISQQLESRAKLLAE